MREVWNSADADDPSSMAPGYYSYAYGSDYTEAPLGPFRTYEEAASGQHASGARLPTPSPISAPTPVASSSRTVLLIENGVIAETQTGLAWSDALDMIWSGERRAPLRVVEIDLARGTAVDLTLEAVKHLAARTVDEGFTPGCLDRFFDEVWNRDEQPSVYAGSVLPCPIRTSPRFAEVVR